jgi:Skp family chaperone for outer membrane proteins
MNSNIGQRLMLGIAAIACIGVGAYATKATTPALRTPPSVTKVATIDIEAAISQLNERTSKENTLKAEGEAASKRLQALKAEIDADKAKLEAMPDNSDKIVAAKALREKTFKLQAEDAAETRKISEIKADMFRALYMKVVEAVRIKAKQDAIHIVMTSDERLQPPLFDLDGVLGTIKVKRLLYVDPDLDITNDIVTTLNNQFNVGSTGAPKKP